VRELRAIHRDAPDGRIPEAAAVPGLRRAVAARDADRTALLYDVGGLRLAHATNERSADKPHTLSALKSQHGSGCSCCSGLSNKKSRKTARGKNGAKSFPARGRG